MSTLPMEAPRARRTYGGLQDLPERPMQLVSREYHETASFVAKSEWAEVEMQAPAGSGANTDSTTQGPSGGQGGQFGRGLIRFVKGRVYTYTHGAPGAALTGGTFPANGNDGGTSTLIGPRVRLKLLGGKGGKMDGSVHATRGIEIETTKGWQQWKTTQGGEGNASAVGDNAPDVEDVEGGLAGTGFSGGGGGSSRRCPGGTGGNTNAAGNAPADPFSGAASGAAGVSADGVVGFAVPAAAAGYLLISWYEE